MDLDDVNDYYVRTSLWPAIVYTIVTMVIGLIGNGLVLIIYRKDYQKSVTWVFVYYLAVLDMLSCLISMPSELIILFNMMSFPSVAWCRISRYLSYIFHGCSCVVLMFIAFNRYDRVCRLGNQWLNLKKARRICIGVFFFVCAMDSPAAIFYGDAKVKIAIQDGTARLINEEDVPHIFTTNNTNLTADHTVDPSAIKIITGHMCLISSEYSGGILTLFFMLTQFLMYCALVVLVVFFYTKVIRKMIGYRARQEKLFKLHYPNRNGSIKEETSEGHLSEEVKSDTFGKDFITDSANNSSFKRANNASKETEAVCETKGDQKPRQVTDSEKNDRGQQKLANGVDIIFAGSDVENVNNLSKSSDPLESNKLLSRRIRSVEVLDKTLPPVPKLVIPNENVNNPLFLHARRTQKKRGKYESERRDETRKYCSDDQILANRRSSRDDLYLHKESQLNGSLSKSMEVLSLSVTDPLNVSQKTMTLNRRSPKGSSQCVLPVSGLSLKTVTTYDGANENINQSQETEGETSNSKQSQNETDENGHKVSTNSAEAASGDEIETAETSLQTTSGDSETVSIQYPNASPGLKQRGQGAKRLVSQPSVTFSVTDNGEEEQGRRTARSKRLDSMSPLFDTPDKKSPLRKRSRANSLFGPSERTINYSRRMSIKPIKALRTSSMLLIISLAFILSFLPFWVIVIMRAMVGKSFMSSLNPVTLGCFSFFVRSSLVSNAVNPIVYGLINNQFRKRCKAIFKRK